MSSPDFIPGLDLAEQFFNDVVRDLLERRLSGVPYSAALIGYGSEVQGFDTSRSTDHAWGPRMQVFLRPQDRAAVAAELDAALERELPVEFRGYPVRFAFPAGTAARHWVQLRDESFFTGQLGVEPTRMAAEDWLAVPTQVLRELTAGRVFHDELGLLTSAREALAWYPEDVWRLVLACQWARLDQEEPFVGRTGEVGDDLGSAVIAARQARDLMKLTLLINRVYPPYSKWLGTAFAQLPHAKTLTPLLSAALAATSWRERERHLSPAYELVATMQNDLGLAEPLDTTVQPFWDRPFQVLNARRFGEALLPGIQDPTVRDRYPIGAIDQYVDCTDLLDRNAVGLRRHHLSAPGSGPLLTEL